MLNDNPTNQNPERTIKSTDTKLIYLSKYVTRDDLGYHKNDTKKFGSNGLEESTVLTQKKFHCQHLCHGIKNWGREIFEKPRTNDSELLDFYEKYGYIIVCSDCMRDCFVCGASSSSVTGTKHEGHWHCASCYKKAKRKELWQKVKNIMGAKWW